MQVPLAERFLPGGHTNLTEEETHEAGEPGKTGKPDAGSSAGRGNWGNGGKRCAPAAGRTRSSIGRSRSTTANERARLGEARVPRRGLQVHVQADRLHARGR